MEAKDNEKQELQEELKQEKGTESSKNEQEQSTQSQPAQAQVEQGQLAQAQVEQEQAEQSQVAHNKTEQQASYWSTVGLEKEEKKDSKKKKNTAFAWVIRIIIVAILLLIAVFVLDTSKYYKNDDITDRTNLIINNNNVTARVKKDLIIENDVIFMSMSDIKNFFDKYIYEEKDEQMIITTYDDNIAEVGFTGNSISINDTTKRVKAVAIERNDVIYLPISEMTNVYNIELEYIEETGIVTMDSIKKEQVKAEVSKNVSVKRYARILSRTVDKIESGDSVIIIAKRDDGWTKVRTQNGKIGFVKTNLLQNEITVREEEVIKKQVEGKINMFWDYYSEYRTAPNREGEEIEGVNVVSPTFFYIDGKAKFQDKVGQEGVDYIKWAHKNNYKVWAMISNTEASSIGGSSNILKVTSQIMNSYKLRKELINNIVNACKQYDLDGINIDFEYMYERDKDLFSRFIIELQPNMQRIGKVLSVDVTAPDGSPNWSLCFDRTVIANSVDYIVFMGYDQVGGSNDTPGTTAGCNWVENNIVKFINNYDVDPQKLILGIPFYTRLWTETADGKVSSKAIAIKDVESNIPSNVTKTWDEDLKQYFVQYKSGSKIQTMWIEDNESLKEKVSLVTKYNLAGVSAWQKGQEDSDTFKVIAETLNEKQRID